MGILVAAFLASGADESARRGAFEKEFQSKEAAQRVEALKKLAGAKESKTLELLARGLKDAAKEVRLAAAETLEGCTDGGGVAVKALCAGVTDPKEDPAVRLACAKALAKSPYQHDPIDAMIKAICSISNKDRDLFKFGSDVTGVLEARTGETSFGRGKETPMLWQGWWKENEPRLKKEDEQHRKEFEKAGK